MIQNCIKRNKQGDYSLLITAPNTPLLYMRRMCSDRLKGGDPYENRTRVTAVKGRCLSRLTNGPGSGDWT